MDLTPVESRVIEAIDGLCGPGVVGATVMDLCMSTGLWAADVAGTLMGLIGRGLVVEVEGPGLGPYYARVGADFEQTILNATNGVDVVWNGENGEK